MQKQNLKKCNGFSLIEVLVATAVSAIALLGLAAGQVKSLQYATNSLSYTLSIIQANNAVEQSWARICELQNGTLNFNDLDTDTQAPKYNIAFPNGFNVDNFEVSVSWQDERMTDQLGNSSSLQVKLPRVCS